MANDSPDAPRILRPISGGSDAPDSPSPPADPPAPEPPGEPPPDPTPPPPPDPAAQLRTEIAELRGELRGRTAGPASAPPPAPRVATAEDIEAAYQSGRITIEQRDSAIDDLKFHQRYETVRARERQQDADAQANAALSDLVRRHPELGQASSPMLREVEERMRVLAQRGLDPRALATQLTAAEFVVEQRRTSRPTPPPVVVSTGGAGSFAGGPPSGAAPRDEFADIPQSTRDYWTRTGIPPNKWKPYAEAWRANQQRRAAKYQSILGRQAG